MRARASLRRACLILLAIALVVGALFAARATATRHVAKHDVRLATNFGGWCDGGCEQ